jgi:hypothetical protein
MSQDVAVRQRPWVSAAVLRCRLKSKEPTQAVSLERDLDLAVQPICRNGRVRERKVGRETGVIQESISGTETRA